MLISFRKNQILCRLLCVLFLVLVGMLIAVRGGAVASDRETLGLYLSEGEPVLYLCAEGSLYQSAQGGVLALRVTVLISEGWTLDSVVTCPSTEGMTVTVGGCQGEVCILLDGIPPDPGQEAGGGSLLELHLSRTEGSSPLSVTLCEGEFYYMDPHFEVCTRPVSLPELSTDPSDDIIFSQETTSKRDDIPPETGMDVTAGDDTRLSEESTTRENDMTADTACDTTCGGELDPEGTASALRSIYMGCQETPVREGEYAVRFLFVGETPVVCGEGGGLLRMEITKASAVEETVGQTTRRHEGNWSVCTFYGLRADRSYVFLVYTGEKVVSVCYNNGKYFFKVLRSS